MMSKRYEDILLKNIRTKNEGNRNSNICANDALISVNDPGEVRGGAAV